MAKWMWVFNEFLKFGSIRTFNYPDIQWNVLSKSKHKNVINHCYDGKFDVYLFIFFCIISYQERFDDCLSSVSLAIVLYKQ